MIFTLLALAYALWVFADRLGMCYVVLGAALLLAWAWWELRELPRPISRPIANKELSSVCFLLIDSVENPLFEQLLWWVLPRGVCIKRFQHRVMLRDYTVVYSWPPVDYYTSAERLLRRALPDNFLVRHLLHGFFHDMPRGGMCPVDGIKTGAGTTLFGFCDYMSWFSSTKPYLYITTSNVLEMQDSDNARLAEEASCKADGASTLPGGTSDTATLRSCLRPPKEAAQSDWPSTDSWSDMHDWDSEIGDISSGASARHLRAGLSRLLADTATAVLRKFLAPPKKRVRFVLPTDDDQHDSADAPNAEDGGQAPRLESSSSLVGRDSPDDIFAVLVRWEISVNKFTPRRYCLDCAMYRDELKVAEHLMTSTLEDFQRHCARPEDHGDILLSRKLSDAQFDAYKAYCALGDKSQDHALTHCEDYATPATTIRRPFRVQPPSKPDAPATPGHTRSTASPVTRTTPGRTQSTAPLANTTMMAGRTRPAAPPVTRTAPGRTRPAVPLKVITTPAPSLVAAASTDTTAAGHTQTTAPKANTTPVAHPHVAAPPAPSNNDGAADTVVLANSTSTLPTSTMVDNALPANEATNADATPANANSAGDSTLPENNTSTPPASSTVDNAASVHITGAAVKTSSASNSSEPPGNDSVGCSTPAKRKRATDIPSQQDIEEAFRRKEWRPSRFGRCPNSKRGRRRQLRRNASLFKNMARVPTQQRANSTLRKRIAALVRRVSTNSGAVTGCLSGDKPTRGWLPGNKPPVTRAQTAATLVDTTTPAPSLVAAASTASTTMSAPSQTAAPPATLTTPASSQVAAAQAVLTLATHAQTAATPAVTTTPALAQTAATPQLTQRTIGMDVDDPAQNIVPELYPAGQGAIGVGIAHAAAQQQTPDTVDMDIEAPGQDVFVDNRPAVYNGIHALAPQPVDITLGMDVDTTKERAVAELDPAGQSAVVGDDMRAPVQEQVQGAPGMDVDVPPQHVGAGIGMDPVDQGATAGGLAQAPAPQPANSTLGMDVDATGQHAVAELDRVGRDTMRPFADWVVARSARYATLRAYLRKMWQLDRAAPYHVPTREQRRRLRRKWAEANNAAAQQHQQSTLGASTAAPTQHAAIDSEAVVGTSPAGQGAIEGDTAHASPQQQPGPGIVNPADLPRATDGGQNNDGLPDYEDPDDSSTSHYWVEQRRDFLDGPPDTDYDRAIERMFQVLVVDSLEDARRNGVDNVGNLRELVVMPDDFIIRDYRAGHNESEEGYIDLPDEPIDEEYGPEAPAQGQAPNDANDGDYSDAESDALTVDTVLVPSDGEGEQ
ncbi:hypothetical protein GGI14_000829 [Coemansia sp. S680]|nr:hypothetical protein GGI14_000829 [Coemansia sp. S680]